MALASRNASIDDLLAVVKDAQSRYDAEDKHQRTQKWLVKFSKRVHHYGNTMDVLCQHHPEYVSLAWGAMKLLFTVPINSATTIPKSRAL